MAKYTTEVRSVCAMACGMDENATYSTMETVLTKSAPVIFDFDFPIFDEDYRLPLERKILRHYFTREIGEETVGLWKLRLSAKMNEIMPYYNQLYSSQLYEFNPFYDVDITTTHTRDNTGSNTRTQEQTVDIDRTDTGTVKVSGSNSATGNRSDDNWRKYSDTPQGGIDGLSADTYLTNAEHLTGTETTTNSGTNDQTTTNNLKGTTDSSSNLSEKGSSSNLEEYSEKVVGKRGGTSYAKLLKEFRESFLNIDAMIIDELQPLFLNLW